MAQKRFNAKLPDLRHPVVIKRDLQIAVGENGNTEWVQLTGVNVDQLARDVLFVPVGRSHLFSRGEVWSRNLELTENGGGNLHIPASHRFQRFRLGLYPALRTLTRLPRKYVDGEIPILTRKREQIHWLLTVAYRLRRHDAEQEELFERKAGELARSFGSVRKREKVVAKARLQKAAKVHDPRGVRNPNRLPLLFWSSDAQLDACIRGDRLIARKLDFRAIVLADYLEQMLSLLRLIDRAVCDKLMNRKLFEDGDSHLAITSAAKMRRFAQDRLRQIHIRPFRRSITHIADELLACANALEMGRLDEAKSLLRQSHRSIVLTTEHHRRLEGVLMVVSDVRQFGVPLHAYEMFDLIELLRNTERALQERETITGEFLEEGFSRKVLPKVISHVREARAAIEDNLRNGGKMDDAYDHLKAACEPL